jgi:hypothetical protein
VSGAPFGPPKQRNIGEGQLKTKNTLAAFRGIGDDAGISGYGTASELEGRSLRNVTLAKRIVDEVPTAHEFDPMCSIRSLSALDAEKRQKPRSFPARTNSPAPLTRFPKEKA